ncbi:MAG: hypothetical protein J6Q82_00035 [Clostridia bacterium]|nr:hypothetical protein [Clostridia bacterium]
MKRSEKLKKILKSRFAVGLVCVLVASYTLYHLIGLFDGEIATFAAGVTTEHTTLSYDGYVFRDETVLYASGNASVADYAVSDGTKVARGQSLATVYEGKNEQAKRLQRIDEQIVLLEASLDGLAESTDPAAVKSSVSGSYDNLIKMIALGESGGLSEERDRFLRGLNQLDQLWDGEEAPSAKTLEALRTEREELLGSLGGGVTYTAEQSGYFYSVVDGYEQSFSTSALESMSGEDFFSLITKPASSTTGAYGKISYTSEWRLVLPVQISEQKYFEVGEVYEALFEENGKSTLPLTVERIVEVPAHASALVIFSCDRLLEDFDFDRCQSVKITVDTVSGIYVPKSNVTRLDGTRGVYILRGSVVYFRQIDIIYEGSDYYLVKEGLESDDEIEYLQINDLIITEGKNLFDGRVVD